MKIAVSEKIIDKIDLFDIDPTMVDYEGLYLTEDQRKKMPSNYRPIVSCNWGVFASATSFDETYLSHPKFGEFLGRGQVSCSQQS